ncbi:MAG: DUF302 domain-containing protein [Acidihalobacter sp.]|uniref:DUF302 domain-containing protein n=1 Tax=Acidihalobacter sp. TaxID=1872108 RepID=UPI00307DAE4D
MKTFTTHLSADETVKRLLAGVDAANMRLVAHINGQENARKMGKEVSADQILEVFRPDFAIRVWQAYKPAGYDIPLRIHVYENSGATCVACRMPSEVFSPYAKPALTAIGWELDDVFEQILAGVPEALND